MQHPDKVLILGGGISGLSVAWRLLERGIPATVLEANSRVGGLAGTASFGPYHLDFGPHSFFSEDEEVRRAVLDLFSGGLPEVQRSVKLHYRDKYLNYPFTPVDLLSRMGFREAVKTLWSFLASRFKRRSEDEDEESVEDWALKNFGSHLYASFFKPYTEQFWKIPSSELSARTIPAHTRTSFTEALRAIFKTKAGGRNLLEREKLPTYYPAAGYGEIAEKIAAQIKGFGGQILFPAFVTRVVMMNDEWVVFYSDEKEERSVRGACVISTLPVNRVLTALEPAVPDLIRDSARKLEFRPILVLGLITAKQNVLNCAYQYTLDRPYNRLSEMNRFSPATSPEGENILALEIPSTGKDPVWQMTQEELFEMCLPALEKDGILLREDVRGLLLVKAPNAYPIYRKGYKKHLQVVLSYLRGLPRFETLGRSGEFMYMDADRCMRRAFDLAGRLNLENSGIYAGK